MMSNRPESRSKAVGSRALSVFFYYIRRGGDVKKASVRKRSAERTLAGPSWQLPDVVARLLRKVTPIPKTAASRALIRILLLFMRFSLLCGGALIIRIMP